MHRHRASLTSPALVIHDEPMVDRFDVIVGRVFKGLIRQIRSAGEQGVGGFFAHIRIIGRFLVLRHPYLFGFVHVANVTAGQE